MKFDLVYLPLYLTLIKLCMLLILLMNVTYLYKSRATTENHRLKELVHFYSETEKGVRCDVIKVEFGGSRVYWCISKV